jgi:hypothetical protein
VRETYLSSSLGGNLGDELRDVSLMPIWLSRNGTDVRVVIQQEYIMGHFLYIISDKDVGSIHWNIPSKNAM